MIREFGIPAARLGIAYGFDMVTQAGRPSSAPPMPA